MAEGLTNCAAPPLRTSPFGEAGLDARAQAPDGMARQLKTSGWPGRAECPTSGHSSTLCFDTITLSGLPSRPRASPARMGTSRPAKSQPGQCTRDWRQHDMSPSNFLISRDHQTGRTGLAQTATRGGLIRPETVAANDQARLRVGKCRRSVATSARRRTAGAPFPSRPAPRRRPPHRRQGLRGDRFRTGTEE